MTSQKPYVGAIVHFVSVEGHCMPAIVAIVKADDKLADRDPIGAIVFNANGTLAPETAWQTYRGQPGERAFWHWPDPACP